MGFKKLCYIDKNKEVVPFVPESNIKIVKASEYEMKKIFPYKKGLNYDNLMMTNIGIYSGTNPYITGKMIEIIKKTFKNHKNLVITDANGGVGGFSLQMAKNFGFVKIVEIEKIHTRVIKNNLKEYGFSNFKVYNKDYLDIMMKLKQDIIVFDPPWGGKGYKSRKKILLELDNVDISCIIKKLYDARKFKLVIFLIPYNFDLEHFKEISGITNFTFNKYISGNQNAIIIPGK